MPRRRTNSLKLTIRLAPEDVARLDDLCLPDEPRSTAAARLLQRILRQPDPWDELLDAVRRIERRLSAMQGSPSAAPEPNTPGPADKVAPDQRPSEPMPDETPGEPGETTSDTPQEPPRAPDAPAKPDLGLTGILEGFDLL